MKTIIFTFLFMLAIVANLNAQSKHGYNDNSGFRTSHGLVIGGVAFSAIGFLTPSNYTYVYAPNNTSSYNMKRQAVPFFQQGPKAACIVTGVTLTITGLISLAAGK